MEQQNISEYSRSKLGLLVTGPAVVGHKIKEVSKELHRVSED
jgi:hypothetical protein